MTMTAGVRGYLLRPGAGVPGEGTEVKASRVSTRGSQTLIESRTKGGAPWHVHTREDEAFYVMEGLIVVRCADDVYEAGPRSFVFMPRGVPHQWDVVGDEATILIITAPGGLEEFLRELHVDGRMAEHAGEVAARYGIEFVGAYDAHDR